MQVGDNMMETHASVPPNFEEYFEIFNYWLQKSIISYLRACLKQEATALNTKTPSGILVHSLLYCHFNPLFCCINTKSAFRH